MIRRSLRGRLLAVRRSDKHCLTDPAQAPAQDDRGSLVFAMLVTMVAFSVTLAVLPMVLTQIGTTEVETGRARALGAAQAGLDSAVAQIQAANDGNGVGGTAGGLISELPCGSDLDNPADPLAGTVSAGDNAGYQVSIDYFQVDPKGHDQDANWITTYRIPCVGGTGTKITPSYALLRSTGTDSAGGSGAKVLTRRLVATYTFKLTNANITGGLIHVFRTSVNQNDLCLDAGSATPAAGAAVTMQPCSPGSGSQTFAYNTNLTLTLVSSKVATNPTGLCLDAGSPQAAGLALKVQQCAATTQPQQQWSYDGAANFAGTTDGKSIDDFCFNVQSPNVSGSPVVLGSGATSTCAQPYDNKEAFSPEASVGAGAAGAATGQLVNFDQFGRCLDVTGGKTNATFLIAWPCKQSPDPSLLSWNQLWDTPDLTGVIQADGHITTTTGGTTYCLESPGSTAYGQYVVITPCSGAPAAYVTWTVVGDTGTYATSYLVKDSFGNCLAPTDPSDSPPDTYNNGSYQVSKIVVAACDGSELQKWNAPPNILDPLPIMNVGER